MSPLYQYVAKSKNGENLNGELEADNSTLVVRQLRDKGYYVTSIEEKTVRKNVEDYINFQRKVKTKDLAVFSQMFSAMIDAGISLVDSLHIMQEEVDHPRLKEVLFAIQESVETGSSLSEAMMQYPDVFPELYCQMIKAGEAGGVLDKVLTNMAEHYDKQDEINGKVKSALYYPAVIIVVAIIAVIFMIAVIVPMFVDIFASMGGKLPLPTRILMGISDFVRGFWWAIIALVVGSIFSFNMYRKTPRGKFQLDKLILKLPVIGNMMRKIYLSRFSSTLAVLLDSGVDLLSALTIIEEIIGNEIYVRIITDTRSQVREGTVFSKPLADSGEFPSMVIQMIKIGEEAGSIEKMLVKVADFYDREVASSIEGAISLIEPMLIVFLAVVVGSIVISIIMPMFDMFQYM